MQRGHVEDWLASEQVGFEGGQRSVGDDGDRVGEVEAPSPTRQGDPPGAFVFHQVRGEADALPSEDEHVTDLVFDLAVQAAAVSGEEETPSACQPEVEGVHVDVFDDVDVFPVVQASPADGFLVRGETEGMDEVKACVQPDGQSSDIARIGRNLGLEQCDVEPGPGSTRGSPLSVCGRTGEAHAWLSTGSRYCPMMTRAGWMTWFPMRYPVSNT